LAYLEWPTAYIAHVGDSRAYLCRRKELVQVTQDQTVAQMLADAGAIEPDAVAGHPFRNMLASLLSCEPDQLKPCVYQIRLEPGDQLLLCTDGLTKHVSASQIAAILDFSGSAAEACQELVAAANNAGGTDNITVVLAQFGSGAQKDEWKRANLHNPRARSAGYLEREGAGSVLRTYL
jgi:protein phosphatase